MSNSKAPIRLYSSSFAFVAEIDDYEQSYFTRSLTGYGEFQITLNFNSPYASLLRKDSFVLFGTDRRRLGVIEDIERQIGSGGKGSQKVIVSGYQAKAILARRIVIPASGQDYYTASDDQETVIKNLVLDHIGASAITARKVTFLTVVPTSGRGDAYELKTFNSSLADIVKTVAEASSPYIGTEVYIDSDGEGLIFDVIVGKDRRNTQSANRRICFSSDFDTVKSGSLIEQNSGYKNVVYVGGQGDGNAKTIVKVTDPVEETGVARREKYFDASSLQTVAQLTNAGESELNALKQAVLAIDVDVLVKSQYVYGVDYDLGDLVNLKEYGSLFEAQITEITESWGHGTYDIVVGFGKSAPTIASSMSSIFSNADQTNTNKSSLRWKDKTVSYDISSGNATQSFDEILCDTIEIIGTTSADRIVTLQTPDATTSVGSKRYRVSIASPKSGDATQRKITLTTGVGGKTSVDIPLIPSTHTLISTGLVLDVSVDSTGNVSASTFYVEGTDAASNEYILGKDLVPVYLDIPRVPLNPGAGSRIIPGYGSAALVTNISTSVTGVDASRVANTMGKVAEYRVPWTGTYTVKFKLASADSTSKSARIYKNGSAFGTLRSSSPASWVIFTQDLSFAKDDLVQLYLQGDGTNAAYMRDFALCFNGYGATYL